jgi:hypothetical protein
MLVALTVGLTVSACGGGAGDNAKDPATTAGAAITRAYPGDLGSTGCATHWFTGSDETAKFTCGADAYRIAFAASGQESSRAEVEPAAVMTVDATLRGVPASLVLDPGVGCWEDESSGWLAEVGTGSRYFIVAYRASAPLRIGTSSAVHRPAAWNHLVLTCDASGPKTRITLQVNGQVVARALDAGEPVMLGRFGVFAAGQAGATLEVQSISATTR